LGLESEGADASIRLAAERNCLLNPSGSTLGSHEWAKWGEKRPYRRFAIPKTGDPDPYSYLSNSFRETVRKGVRVASSTGSSVPGNLELPALQILINTTAYRAGKKAEVLEIAGL
jgi:hypothetical protein